MKTNEEIEAQLDALAQCACSTLTNQDSLPRERIQRLVEALVTCGFGRESRQPLIVELEKRIRDGCRESASHRGAEVKALASHIQEIYNDVVRWKTHRPKDDSMQPPQAANISSSTDS